MRHMSKQPGSLRIFRDTPLLSFRDSSCNVRRIQGLIISVIGCTSSVDPLSQETSFSDNVAVQLIKKSEAIERRCMAEHGTDKIPAQIIGLGHATPHGDQTSGESGEV